MMIRLRMKKGQYHEEEGEDGDEEKENQFYSKSVNINGGNTFNINSKTTSTLITKRHQK